MENGLFEDVFPIKNWGYSIIAMLVYQRVTICIYCILPNQPEDVVNDSLVKFHGNETKHSFLCFNWAMWWAICCLWFLPWVLSSSAPFWGRRFSQKHGSLASNSWCPHRPGTIFFGSKMPDGWLLFCLGGICLLKKRPPTPPTKTGSKDQASCLEGPEGFEEYWNFDFNFFWDIHEE